jgi:hypothetical protein
MLYRPVPADFPAKFVELGWVRIGKHYRAHGKTIKRWLTICGEEGLRQQRRDYLAENGYNRRRTGELIDA